MKYYFDTYKDAVALARKMAAHLALPVDIKKERGQWYVKGPEIPGARPKTHQREPRHPNKPSSQKIQVASFTQLKEPKKPNLKSKANSRNAPHVQVRGRVREEDLCAIKVFYLGRGIASALTRSEAIKSIETELNALNTMGRADRRVLFFTLLLAEIFRGTNHALGFRKEAQGIDGILRSGMFDAYMKVAEATLKKTSVDPFTGQRCEHRQYRGTSSYIIPRPMGSGTQLGCR